MSKRRYYGRRTRSRNDASQRARAAHVKAAKEFSDTVGAADIIVKQAFFGLSDHARNVLFDRYEHAHGKSARTYAQQNVIQWQTNQRRMSGIVARRLFDLMPPMMDATEKHQVVELIWKRYGPYSKHFVLIGPNADVDAVMKDIEKYFSGLEILHAIPEELEKKFSWISNNDVTLKQQLLNYFMEKQLENALQSARLFIEMIIQAISALDDVEIKKLQHCITIGNHCLELHAQSELDGYSLTALDPMALPRHVNTMSKPISNTMGVAFICAIIICFLIWVTHSGS
jgi:hypothetical protein